MLSPQGAGRLWMDIRTPSGSFAVNSNLTPAPNKKPGMTSTEKVQNPNLENTAHVPPPEEEDSIFIEIPKPKAKKTVNVEIQDLNSPRPNSYPSKLPYPERMKVRENDKPSAQHSRFLKMFKQLRLEIGLKDALVEMPKFNKWLSSLLRNKEKLEEIAITTVNAECSAIIMNKVPEKLEDPGKFLIPCALQELNRTTLTPTRMTLELANRSITHPMGIAEDVVVRVDGFTFLADFVVVNFEPDPRVPIILGRPFLRTAKALIDLYEETLTLRVGKEELVYYADKSEKNKNKHFVHAISVIDFSKDDPFSGSTTTHSDDPSPSSSPVKTSDNFEKFADELSPLDSLPPGNDDSTLKKDLHEENFQVYSNPLFEFDDNFKSSTINPLFDEMEEDVEIKNSNVFDEPVLLNTPLSDKVAQEDDNDEIDAFLAMEVSSNFEEGYFDSEGGITFLDNLLSDDALHNLASEVISDHEPEQNESSTTFSPRSDPLHHEFAGELLTLPSGNDREFGEYLSLMTVLCEISTSQSHENVHANQSSVIESLPVSPIPVEDSEPAQEEIDIFLVPDDLIPPGAENDDSEDEDNELPNLDHQDDPSIPRPPPEPPDVEKCFEPEAGILITKVFKGVSKPHDFMADILPTLPTLVSYLTFILFLSSFLSFGSEDTVFDPGIVTFHKPVAVSMKVSCSKYGYIKNHKKTIKNGQAQTRETEELYRSQRCKAKARKSQTFSQHLVNLQSTLGQPKRRPTLGLLILPSVPSFSPTIRRTARMSVLPIEPNLAERARISAINLDDYQHDPLLLHTLTLYSHSTDGCLPALIARNDPTRREEAQRQLHTILKDMDRYPNSCLEELEAFMTLWDDAEDLASNAQEKARQKRKEALKEVVQQIYRNNN
ncbi:reverse transcriptase domain-containing protein [Tanacetum coccineum]